MKQPYNKTYALAHGPGHVLAGEVYQVGRCRVVPQIAQAIQEAYLAARSVYVTLDPPDAHGPERGAIGPPTEVFFDIADTLVAPWPGGQAYEVLWTESVIWAGRPQYFRVHCTPCDCPPEHPVRSASLCTDIIFTPWGGVYTFTVPASSSVWVGINPYGVGSMDIYLDGSSSPVGLSWAVSHGVDCGARVADGLLPPVGSPPLTVVLGAADMIFIYVTNALPVDSPAAFSATPTP